MFRYSDNDCVKVCRVEGLRNLSLPDSVGDIESYDFKGNEDAIWDGLNAFNFESAQSTEVQ